MCTCVYMILYVYLCEDHMFGAWGHFKCSSVFLFKDKDLTAFRFRIKFGVVVRCLHVVVKVKVRVSECMLVAVLTSIGVQAYVCLCVVKWESYLCLCCGPQSSTSVHILWEFHELPVNRQKKRDRKVLSWDHQIPNKWCHSKLNVFFF